MTLNDLRNVQFEDLLYAPLKVKLGVATVAVLLVAAAIWFALLAPEAHRYGIMRMEAKQLESQVSQAKLVAAHIPEYQVKLKDAQHKAEGLEQQLPDQAQVSALLSGVASAGQSQGLDVTLFQPEHPVSQGYYTKLPVKIRVVGSYDELWRFVAAVAALPRIAILGDISIKPYHETDADVAAGGASYLQMTATLTTYSYSKYPAYSGPIAGKPIIGPVQDHTTD